MSTVVERAMYPAVMDQKLRHIRRRQCALAIFRAMLISAGVLLAAMLAAMLVDWSFTLFSTTARALLTVSALGVALATLLAAAVGPVVASLGLRKAAVEVDQVVPRMEERWTTVASCTELNHQPRSPIATAMLRQVTSEAVALGRLVEPARVAAPQQLQRPAVWLACALAVIAAFLAINWPQHRVLLARFWSPLSNISATQLESLTGDLVVPRGEPVSLVARMAGVTREKATLLLAAEGGAEETVELTRSEDLPDRFTYDIAALESSLRYRVQAGDGRTQWHSVTAIDRPALADVKVTLTAPAYVDRSPYEKDYLPDRIQAVQGSQLRLEMRPEAMLQRFALSIARGNGESTQETLPLTADSDGWYRYEAILEADIALRPELLSPRGLKNVDAQECRIRVIADRAPVARVISPKEETAVAPDEVLDVKFEAHDDHGIATAELVVYEESSDSGEPPAILSAQEIFLGDQENAPHVIATEKLDLSKYDLNGGSRISFAIRVTDNRGVARDKPNAAVDAAVEHADQPVASRPAESSSTQGDDPAPSEASSNQPATNATASQESQTKTQSAPSKESPASTEKSDEPATGNAPSKPAVVDAEHANKPSPDTTAAKPSAETQEGASPPAASTNAAARQSNEPSRDSASADRQSSTTDDLRGQFAESNRLRLKIEEKLTASAEPGDRQSLQIKIRQQLEQIDRELKPAEGALSALLETARQSGIADPQIQSLKDVDGRLTKVERLIADLRNESKETPLAFAGLHMVEIATAHIAPARDRVFALIRQPDADAHGNTAQALHHVGRARELLAELLVRYERMLREEKLAKAIDETAKMYEVYVENLHRFLRAQSKPNPNPLQRKMAIVEVDQEYLDRLRQVTEMRRDLMAEFARMLGDDPRLLSKYMDLIKRRQTSLRDRLTELHKRQEVLATELSGWLRVDPMQREDVWLLAAEVRLQDVAPLAQEASQLAERAASQFPLGIDPGQRSAAAVIEGAKQVAVRARSAATKARRLLRDPLDESVDLAGEIVGMELLLSELDAALESLAFEKSDEETTDYANKRLAEGRTLMERILGWSETAAHLQERRFHGVAKVDQGQLALQTELLRIDVQNIDQQLATEFRSGVPESVTSLANELKQIMEAITFNQQAATFELEGQRLKEAEGQQALALDGFKRAEELFDRIRRQVIEEADKIDPPDPNIADLTDPTLDQLLERLEREPNLNALLGLPNRPRNLRVISDFFASQEGDVPVPDALQQAADQARERAKQEQKQARRMPQQREKDADKTDEEWRKVADAEEAQEKLQARIEELKRQAGDPATEPEEAAKLAQLAEQLEKLRRELAGRQIDDKQWREMVRSDQMRAILRAAAQGEPLPDTQWNRIVSSLDDGLWQVRRRTPPEEYRRAIEQYRERIRKLMNLEAADEQ